MDATLPDVGSNDGFGRAANRHLTQSEILNHIVEIDKTWLRIEIAIL